VASPLYKQRRRSMVLIGGTQRRPASSVAGDNLAVQDRKAQRAVDESSSPGSILRPFDSATHPQSKRGRSAGGESPTLSEPRAVPK